MAIIRTITPVVVTPVIAVIAMVVVASVISTAISCCHRTALAALAFSRS
jgi:hypothetical protein